MKKWLLIIGILFSQKNLSQTGIGTTTPDASAKLEISSNNKGFLPPRVTLTSTTDSTTIINPATGLLVYNTGSNNNILAGYYYWNGNNWATIATATGSGVTSSELVKLYGKTYSTASGDIANASGYSFTVPVSGRYLFDFSSSAYANTTATISFSVRQGASIMASDAQTGLNNTVHVEYNGKIEVILQAGTTYNVYVNTTGLRDSGDYDRVYMKQVSGNLPIDPDKSAGIVNSGVPVTLGTIQVQMAVSGSRSLQIKTTGINFAGMLSGYSTYNTNSYTYFSDVSQTINGTMAYLGAIWNFVGNGDLAVYYLRDNDAQRFWRITLMVGPGYNNNFISIEKLL